MSFIIKKHVDHKAKPIDIKTYLHLIRATHSYANNINECLMKMATLTATFSFINLMSLDGK